MNGGIFEIDPAAATNRPLPAGSPSSCGGAGGLLSPDGQRAIKKTGKQIELVEVKTGEDRVIEGVTPDTSCVWSPNGHSIACVRDGEIVIINANDAARQRNLGAGIGPVEWSPDSKHLLFRISQLSCLLTLYFDSLEVLDIETAKRTLVKNSHCQVTAGPHGWIDPTVATK
jgi:WD40 repeat protein